MQLRPRFTKSYKSCRLERSAKLLAEREGDVALLLRKRRCRAVQRRRRFINSSESCRLNRSGRVVYTKGGEKWSIESGVPIPKGLKPLAGGLSEAPFAGRRRCVATPPVPFFEDSRPGRVPDSFDSFDPISNALRLGDQTEVETPHFPILAPPPGGRTFVCT